MSNELKLDNDLAKDAKPVKVGDDSTGLLLGTDYASVDKQPTEAQHIANKQYVDSSRIWQTTFGGYKTNNNSSVSYYYQYYPNGNSWSNTDTSPTSLSYFDAYSYQFCALYDGLIKEMRITLRASDTGTTDPLKFYVFKGNPVDEGGSTTLTQIGVTTSITPVASKQMVTKTKFVSGNQFSKDDKLWVMYKKDSTSGNQDLYFGITLNGVYM